MDKHTAKTEQTHQTVMLTDIDVTLIKGSLTTQTGFDGHIWHIFRGVGGGLKLGCLRSDDVFAVLGGVRQSDGSYMGCGNQAWIITSDERAQLIQINEQRYAAKLAAEPARLAGLDKYEADKRAVQRMMTLDGGTY